MFEWINKIFRNWFSQDQLDNNEVSNNTSEPQFSTPRFNEVTRVEKTPDEGMIGPYDFVLVVYRGKSYYAMFKCPCGCGSLISLPLQSSSRPSWHLKSLSGKPSLYPSIRKIEGCCSHFWVEEGKVIWCSDYD